MLMWNWISCACMPSLAAHTLSMCILRSLWIWINKGQLAYKVWLVGPIKNASFGSTTETPRKEESEFRIFSLICETNSKGQSFWMLPDSLGGAFGEINLGWNSKWFSCQTFLSTVQFWICLLSRKPGQALFEKHPLEGWRTFWLV